MDTGDPAAAAAARDDKRVSGVTTNATLLRPFARSGYAQLAKQLAGIAAPKPISLPVLSTANVQICDQARRLAAVGNNVFVKIPCIDSTGRPMSDTIRRLNLEGLNLNVTGICSSRQVVAVSEALRSGARSIMSIMAGRIADGGNSAVELAMIAASAAPTGCSVLWASTRQIADVYAAQESGCHIITCPPSLIALLARWGQTAESLSIEAITEMQNAADGIRW